MSKEAKEFLETFGLTGYADHPNIPKLMEAYADEKVKEDQAKCKIHTAELLHKRIKELEKQLDCEHPISKRRKLNNVYSCSECKLIMK